MFALWMTLFFLFLDRVNIALAAPYIMEELKLSGVETGIMLSAYYWGYVAGQLGGGVAADRWTIRRWASVMFFLWCVLTALTGACRSLTQLAIVRGFFGVSEGAVANPLHKLENHWLLPDERGRVYGLSMGFGYLGLILGTPLVGWLIEGWGWRVMFFSTGGLTLLGVGLFWLLVYDHPHQHPWVSEEEKVLIAEAVHKDRVTFDPQRHEAPPLSLRAGVALLTTNPMFWLLCIAGFCALGVFFTNLSWLPGYLVKERHYAVATSGIYLILPYAAAFAGALLAGYLGDRTGNRSLVALVTGLLTGPAILAMLYSESVTSVVLLMSLVLFLNAAATNSLVVLLFDLFPAEVLGITVAIFAGVCGGAGGIVGPIALGRSYDLTGSFFWGFCSLAGAALVAALVLIPVAFYERRVKKEKREKAEVARLLAQNEPVALHS
jgi:sugar phosphate permease